MPHVAEKIFDPPLHGQSMPSTKSTLRDPSNLNSIAVVGALGCWPYGASPEMGRCKALLPILQYLLERYKPFPMEFREHTPTPFEWRQQRDRHGSDSIGWHLSVATILVGFQFVDGMPSEVVSKMTGCADQS
jgi:hypothetical protein